MAFIAIQTEWVQNRLLGIATSRLSNSLGTEVKIKHISFALFNRVNLDGMLIRDKQKDTLLYAGQFKIRITDWFFFKDKADLKFIGLEDAKINMNRKDAVWNYQYIIDFFASPDTTRKRNGVKLNLKKIDFKNVHLLKKDQWAVEIINVTIGSLLLEAENIDLTKKEFFVNTIKIDNPFIKIQQLTPLRPDELLKKKPAKIDTAMYFNGGNISLKIENFSIRNGNFFIDADSIKPLPYFDGSHIQLSKLNAKFANISFLKDTIKADIELSVKDRCGLEIKRLKTVGTLTPQILELSKLDLQTNKSYLRNYYAMKFKDFNKNFGHYNSQIIMDGRFKDSKINSDDIAYFAPELKNIKKEIKISGNFLGTVENFNFDKLVAKIGVGTQVNGTLSMKGLPEINKTNIRFTKGSLSTNYYDLGLFFPSIKSVTSPNLAALGTIIYRGNFNGTIQNFVTTGNFSTQLGGFNTNISLQLPKKGEPIYSGALETVRFNIGSFLNDTTLGLVDFKGKIIGTGFNIEKLKTTLEGNVSSLEYNHYAYSNIVTNGTFQKKYFTGEIKINDPNLDFNSTVEIDLTQTLPRFNIVGDLVHSNLKALQISKDSIQLTGLLDVNFTGTNIDNFLGSAKFLNATIIKGALRQNFDSLNLISSYLDSVKTLHLGSNDFNATIFGKFAIQDLPASFESFLNQYYPTYIKPPKSIPQNQQFKFIINTSYIEPFIKFWDNKASGFNDISLKGSIDTRSNQLEIFAKVPFVKYQQYSITGLDLVGIGNIESLTLNGKISTLSLSDSLIFPNTQLSIESRNDHSKVSIKTDGDNTFQHAVIDADIYTLSDGFRLQFMPSSFILNEKKWTIEKNGELVVRTNLIQAQNLKFVQGFQEISVETREEDVANSQNLDIKLKDVVMGDLTSLLIKDPKLEGIVSGKVALNDFYGQFHADADLKVQQFRLDEDSIGLLNIKAGYNSKTGLIPFTIESPNKAFKLLVNGKYNLSDTTGNSLNTDIVLEDTKIDILHKFLSGIFSDIHGQATGKLNISGDINHPDLLGKVNLRNASMKVNYTQVAYELDSTDIEFESDGINFGRFTIHDKYKNSGTIRGKLFEKGFRNMRFDFDLTTDKLLLIDTKVTDNQQFYGKAIGKTNMKFFGPETNAKMIIVAESNDSSHIYIPNSVSRESGDASFIVFKQYGTEMALEKSKSDFNLSVELDLTVTKKVQIDVILDELSGDVIKATGSGRLIIKAGTTEPINIRGRYTIDRGSYVFNFQGLLRKPFVLLPEFGNYIEWTGDPFNADIHIDAQYTAERISLGELASNINVNNGAVKGYRGDVYVIAQLREKLTKPDIKFKLDFPQGSPVKSDNVFAEYLNRLEKDQTEILNQVAFLFLFNSFAPPGGGSGNSSAVTPYSITSIGFNTLSSVLAKSVNTVVSNLLFKLTGDNSLRFDMGASVYSSSQVLNPSGSSDGASNGGLDRTNVDLKLSKAIANDNIIITVGTDIDFNFQSVGSQNGNVQWLPNLNIAFILSQDRKLKFIIFNKSSIDISGNIFGRRNKTGVSISYRKDFETLFGKKENDIEIKTPADSSINKGN